MRVLIDTHAFLWLAVEPGLLSARARTILEESEHEIFLSSISVWEVEQKYQIGKLKLPDVPSRVIASFRNAYALTPITFDEDSAFQLHKLPTIHNDPFDRMLICQAIQHGLTILTDDRRIHQYPVSVIW